MHIEFFSDESRDQIVKMDIDVEIAQDTFNYLIRNDTGTIQDIINYIHETIDPDDFNNETTPLKIKNHLNRMFMHDLLDFNSNKYELTDEFMAQVVSASNRQKGVKEYVE